MFCGLFNFDQNRCIRTLPTWPFSLFIFWNLENTLPILLKHSKCCSFIKKISLSKNSMFCGLFNFDQNRCIRTIPAWPFFFCWYFEILKIPFQFFWNIQNVVLSSKQSVRSKSSMFCGLLKFWPKLLYPDLSGVANLLVDFFGWVFQMVKIPFEFFWNIQNFVLSSKQSVWSKNRMFCGLFNFDQSRCIRTLPVWAFCWLIFWLSFSIGENTLRILLKYSKFCSFIKTISLKEKQHVLRTFQFWPKSLYPDLTGVAIFSIDFLKCWKYHSNSAETFKMLFFHQNNQFEAKTACFADFSILTKIAVSGPYRRGHFVSWFFGCIFQMLKIPFEFFWNIQNFVLSSKQPVWSKNSMFCGLFNFAKVAVSGPYRCGHFVGWFFGWVFQLVKIPLEFFWNIPNLVPSSKQSVWRKNSMFCGLFNFDQNRCIRTLPAWPFFPLIFWNVENTIPILLKHSKCCSFIKNISLKQKQHVLRTFQFWPKSLYLDLTGVAILLVDFFGCIFQMLKIPFEFFWNIQNFVLSSKQPVWSKNSMFCGLFNFAKVAVSGPYRCGHFVGWFFGWVFQLVKIPFEFFWNIPNFVPSSKQSVWSKNSMFFGLFNFDQNRCFRTLPAWQFCWLIFWLSFSNVENSLRILLKHSKFCSFIKTISLKEKQHVLRTFQFWPKSLYPNLTDVAIFFVHFLKSWKYPSNSSETFEMLFFHQKNQFEQKQHGLRTFQFWPKSLYSDHTGVAIFLVDFLKSWKFPSNSSETFKMLFFHQNKQFEAKTACFADFSILTKIAVSGPYRRGHFFHWFFEMLKIPFQFCWNIQNVVLSSKTSVWSKNSMFCRLFNFDQNRCIWTLPAWPFC